MDKQQINKRLIDQYLSGPEGLGRLYRERERRLSSSHGEAGDGDLPEVNERVLELAREAGAEIKRRHRRRFYVPMALAASVLVAVVAVKVLLVPTADTPDIYMLGSEPQAQRSTRKEERITQKREPQGAARALSESPAQQVTRIQELINQGRQQEAVKALAELRQQHPDFPIPADLQSLPRQ